MIHRFIENRSVRLKIMYHIKQLVHDLYKQFAITRQEIASHLCWKFKTRDRHLKYDPEKSTLEVYVGYFTYYALLDMVCECREYRSRYKSIPLSQLVHSEGIDTIGRPIGRYVPDDLIDYDTPEDLYVGLELLKIAQNYFGENDLAVLLGNIDRETEAKRQGLGYHCYCKRLQRKVMKFRQLLEGIGYLDP